MVIASHSCYRPPYLEEKFLIGESALAQLLGVCPLCSGRATVELGHIGGVATGRRLCQDCGCRSRWRASSEVGAGRRVLGLNLAISAATFFSGTTWSDVTRFARVLNLRLPSDRAYHYHQKDLHKVSIICNLQSLGTEPTGP